MNKKLVLPTVLILAIAGHIKACDAEKFNTKGTLIEGFEHLTPAEFADVIRNAPIANSASIFSPYRRTFAEQWSEYCEQASRPTSKLIKPSATSAFTASAGTGHSILISSGCSTVAAKLDKAIAPDSIVNETRLLAVVSPDESISSRASTCVPTSFSVMPVSTCTISESARLSSTTSAFDGSPTRISVKARLSAVSAFLRESALK